jgi:hypothetical protein
VAARLAEARAEHARHPTFASELQAQGTELRVLLVIAPDA